VQSTPSLAARNDQKDHPDADHDVLDEEGNPEAGE
jgi:hypothetical protein